MLFLKNLIYFVCRIIEYEKKEEKKAQAIQILVFQSVKN